MALRQYTAEASSQNLKRLNSRVARRRPKTKNERPLEYYNELIEQLDKTPAIKQNYSDASKDNLRSIRRKFIR
jgi:hypothetical protein